MRCLVFLHIVTVFLQVLRPHRKPVQIPGHTSAPFQINLRKDKIILLKLQHARNLTFCIQQWESHSYFYLESASMKIDHQDIRINNEGLYKSRRRDQNPGNPMIQPTTATENARSHRH